MIERQPTYIELRSAYEKGLDRGRRQGIHEGGIMSGSYPRQEWTMGKTITINGITHPVEAVNLATTAAQVAALFGGTIQDRPEWHDAKPGEVWQVTRKFGTTEDAAWMVVDPAGRFEDYIYEFDVTDDCIVHAERVYPDLFKS